LFSGRWKIRHLTDHPSIIVNPKIAKKNINIGEAATPTRRLSAMLRYFESLNTFYDLKFYF
jgi:hypothetical protein